MELYGERVQDGRAWGRHALNPIKSQMEQAKKEELLEENVAPMSPPTAEEVEYFSRRLDLEHAAVGVEFSRCGGTQPQHIMSFPDSVAFLEPISPYVAWQVHGSAHLIGGSYYENWIRNTVGDRVLADALKPYTENDDAMGKQLASIRPIIRVRLKQYKQANPAFFASQERNTGIHSFMRSSV